MAVNESPWTKSLSVGSGVMFERMGFVDVQEQDNNNNTKLYQNSELTVSGDVLSVTV